MITHLPKNILIAVAHSIVYFVLYAHSMKITTPASGYYIISIVGRLLTSNYCTVVGSRVVVTRAQTDDGQEA